MARRRPHLVDPTPRSSLPVLLGSGAAGYWLLTSHPPMFYRLLERIALPEALQGEVFYSVEFS